MSSKEYKRQKRLEARLAVIRMMGSRCRRCGLMDVRVLQLDHKNGDGYLEETGSKLIARILNGSRDLSDLQLLCANCHVLKTWYAETYTVEDNNEYILVS